LRQPDSPGSSRAAAQPSECYTLSLHDALPIYESGVAVTLDDGSVLRADYLVGCDGGRSLVRKLAEIAFTGWDPTISHLIAQVERSEEHTSELQSRENLVCRLLLEKKTYMPRCR